MDPIFKKLNFKTQPEILVLQAPNSFEPNIAAMAEYTHILRTLETTPQIEFVLSFVSQKAEIERLAPLISQKLKGDALVWFAYPKSTSRKYSCDFNRDTGWQVMGKLGMEPVRMVAIDADWSAVRFRKVEFIKKITRRESMALTDTAKKRTSQKGK